MTAIARPERMILVGLGTVTTDAIEWQSYILLGHDCRSAADDRKDNLLPSQLGLGGSELYRPY